MANLFELLGNAGNALAGYGEARGQQDLLGRKLAADQENEQSTQEERAARLALLRQTLSANLAKENPDMAAAAEQKRREDFIKANNLDPTLATIYRDKGQLPTWYGNQTPREDPQKKAYNDFLTRTQQEVETTGNFSPQLFVSQAKRLGASDNDVASGVRAFGAAAESTRKNKISFEGSMESAREGARIRAEGRKETETETKEQRLLKNKVKLQVMPALKALDDSRAALDRLEKINRDNAELIGPMVGTYEQKNPYRSEKAQTVMREFGNALGVAIKNTKAGSRGYTKYEQLYFQPLVGGIRNRPENNQAIIDDWRKSLEDDRKSWLQVAADAGLSADDFKNLLGKGGFSVSTPDSTLKMKLLGK